MDSYISNIDDSVYRAARARAALEGRSLGELITEALRAYLARTAATGNMAHLLDDPVQGPASKHVGAGHDVDEVVYLYCI